MGIQMQQTKPVTLLFEVLAQPLLYLMGCIKLMIRYTSTSDKHTERRCSIGGQKTDTGGTGGLGSAWNTRDQHKSEL